MVRPHTYYLLSPELRFLQEFRDKLNGTQWDVFNKIVLQPVKNFLRGRTHVIGKYRAIRYGSGRAYIIVRHHKEIAQFLDTAITLWRTHHPAVGHLTGESRKLENYLLIRGPNKRGYLKR